MGKLGFMFLLDLNFPIDLFFDGVKYNKENFVVFVDCNFFDGVRIVSFESKFSYETCDFFYLDFENKLHKHLVFETRSFIKSKISLSDLTNIDLNQGICWVNVNLYNKLRQLLFLSNGDLYDEVNKRIPFLLDIIISNKSFSKR